MASPLARRLLALFEVVTVGLPFGAFKILSGLAVLGRPGLGAIGWALVGLGAIDLALNSINLLPLAAGRPRVVGVCLTEVLLGRKRGWNDLGISADVMLSFGLVAAMIGFGLLPSLSPTARQIWNVAVILNVLGAGLGRLSSSLGRLTINAPASDRPGTSALR